ncbi:MAG: hypothetical protein LJE70_10440 [Chromatiaceae bacterium]|nr:hypothetical protein [Chromatiaceae bacterium]
MSKRGSAESPQNSRPTNDGLGVLPVLLALVAFGVAIGGAFFAGIWLERHESMPLVESMRAIQQERDQLSAQVADLKQQRIVLERSQQFDRKTYRTVSEQLQEAQDERLAAEKEASFLRRLIQDGGSGILQPKDFKLEETGQPGEVEYSFTVQQLIQDFGESTGTVEVKVFGERNGVETTLSVGELAGSAPSSHTMKFKHFQSFHGTISLPDDFEPVKLIVAIKPNTDKLIPVSEIFPWNLE